MAPPFLESVLIEMTNTKFSGSAIVALRRADTPKTRAALAQIANNSDDPMLRMAAIDNLGRTRSEEHTSELQSRLHLVCRLLLEKKNDQGGLVTGPIIRGVAVVCVRSVYLSEVASDNCYLYDVPVSYDARRPPTIHVRMTCM